MDLALSNTTMPPITILTLHGFWKHLMHPPLLLLSYKKHRLGIKNQSENSHKKYFIYY